MSPDNTAEFKNAKADTAFTKLHTIDDDAEWYLAMRDACATPEYQARAAEALAAIPGVPTEAERAQTADAYAALMAEADAVEAQEPTLAISYIEQGEAGQYRARAVFRAGGIEYQCYLELDVAGSDGIVIHGWGAHLIDTSNAHIAAD